MRGVVRYLVLLSFILSGCVSFWQSRSGDMFIEHALRKAHSDYTSVWQYKSEWEVKHTFLPYAGEMMRIYLKSRGYEVPDTTWFDYYSAKEWVLSHKTMFGDTLFMNEMLSIFTEIARSTGLVITDRIERARFEWEINLKDTAIYWYEMPRKIVAVFNKKVTYFVGPFCKEGKNKSRILIAFPSYFSGLIKPINSPWWGEEEDDIDSVLVFFYEGRWERTHLKYFISPERWWPANPILSWFIDNNCIRYMAAMYFLKDGRWYYAYPFSKVLYENPRDAIGWHVAEDPSLYMWGELMKDYERRLLGKSTERSFSDTLFRDIVDFVEKHKGEIVGKRR